MHEKPHGLSVDSKNDGSECFLSMKVTGKLTHDDYQKVSPLIESALNAANGSKVNVFVDAAELDGWELRAAWDDFKLGLKYGKKFKKIALYGSQKWLERSVKIGSWFTSGEIKFFEDKEKALHWLHESQCR